ncbi:MAG: glutaredoxin family protein [Xanthomonadales bacterium]
MKTEPDLILFARPGCHLCEHVARMLAEAGADWREIDIDRDPDLAGRYGLLIPVVREDHSGRELPFPFDADALARFLGG